METQMRKEGKFRRKKRDKVMQRFKNKNASLTKEKEKHYKTTNYC